MVDLPSRILSSSGIESSPTLANTSSAYSDDNHPFQALIDSVDQEERNWVPDPNSKEEANRRRTLVMCFDGTGDQFDDDNSNIVSLVSCLKKDNQSQQLIYYQAGIGTYTNSAFVTPLTNRISKVWDEMTAWNLASHVQSGYEFLMQNYTEGDKVCIFGFSRGAYTARALAGMIQKVGLLPPFNHAQIPFAWAMYAREDADGLKNSIGFKKTFCREIILDFVGVWDTVASVGIVSKELPFVGNNSAIRVFRHALALDEHRVKFTPNFYQRSKTAQGQHGKHKKHRSQSLDWQMQVNEATGIETDVLEVWFAGCHCDIGGGSVVNGTRNALSRIPLRWMIRECFRTNTGIIFDKDLLRESVGIDADRLYPEVLPRPARLIPPAGSKLVSIDKQTMSGVSFLRTFFEVLVVPISFISHLLLSPFHHFGLLLKYTRAGKFVRNIFKRVKNIGKDVGKKDDTEPLVPVASGSNFVSEEEEELADALCPAYDQLSLAKFWWILEFIPFKFRDQRGKRDDFFVRANFGRGRKIYGDALKSGLKIHRSVKTRLEIVDKRGQVEYKPKAWFHRKGPTGKKEAGPKTWVVEEPELLDWEWVE